MLSSIAPAVVWSQKRGKKEAPPPHPSPLTSLSSLRSLSLRSDLGVWGRRHARAVYVVTDTFAVITKIGLQQQPAAVFWLSMSFIPIPLEDKHCPIISLCLS